MARDGQLNVDNKGRYSVPSNTGNPGNCRVNAEDHGNSDNNSHSAAVVTPNVKSTVTGQMTEFQGHDSPSCAVTTVTSVSIGAGEAIIAAELGQLSSNTRLSNRRIAPRGACS